VQARTAVRESKFLSLVLRHQPERIGLRLDESGWAEVDELIERSGQAGVPLTRELLLQIVELNDKKRFALSPDGRRIRASQGHSIAVDLGLPPIEPPELLYHGTADRYLDSIRREGLTARSRNHVHLSGDVQTALKVGARHGRAVVLTVLAGGMSREGLLFYRSANGVWLTERVPARHLVIPVV
jgi:putative RNA 2'-phosphotransferase